MPADRDFDTILDEALASYTAAEPDPSLRARIVQCAEQAAARPSRILWPAVFALAAVALLVVFLLHPTATMPKQKPAAPPIASAPPPAIAAPVTTALAAPNDARFARHRAVRPARAIARSNAFPSPTPLTAQEATLLQFVSEHPEQARQALAASAPGLVESAPLTIAPIRIAALSEPQDPKALP